MTLFASAAHHEAMRVEAAVLMGGNGPDYQAWAAAMKMQSRLVQQTEVELMQGHMYNSPPIFMPPLPERYRRSQ